VHPPFGAEHRPAVPHDRGGSGRGGRGVCSRVRVGGAVDGAGGGARRVEGQVLRRVQQQLCVCVRPLVGVLFPVVVGELVGVSRGMFTVCGRWSW
jgi:hypothetical protein